VAARNKFSQNLCKGNPHFRTGTLIWYYNYRLMPPRRKLPSKVDSPAAAKKGAPAATFVNAPSENMPSENAPLPSENASSENPSDAAGGAGSHSPAFENETTHVD